MAIITIPTSISGITIPGFGGGGGPLDSLYQSGGLPFYKYPRDLGSSTRSHSVVFTIKKIKEIPFSEVVGVIQNEFNNISVPTAGETFQDVKKALIDTGQQLLDDPLSVLDTAATKAGEATSKLSQFVSKREVQNQAIIALYMPETMSFTNEATYDGSTTLASAAGALPMIGGLIRSVTTTLNDNDALKLGLNKMGYVFNPQKQMLFQGIEFRQFNMSFTFTPYSSKESQDVKEIIKLFRKWSAPQKTQAAGGMFFNPPAVFQVDFKFNNSQNLNIPKLKDCVITSVEVNYAPNGMWSAHSDGAPVQTTVTLALQEMDLVDRSDIENGY
jgi:hypothetical protein